MEQAQQARKHSWTDVTERLTALLADGLSAVGSLRDGRAFVGGRDFALSEAMAAVELMDAKMDVWTRSGGGGSRGGAVETDAECWSLSEAEAAGVMDVLLGYAVLEWGEAGAYFAQSVGNCVLVHMESLEEIKHERVKNFVEISVHKLVPAIRSCAGGVADEEDFYGYVPVKFPEISGERGEISDPRTNFVLALAEFLEKPGLEKLEEVKRARSEISPVEVGNFEKIRKFFDPTVARHLWPPGPPRKFREIGNLSEIYPRIDKLLGELELGLRNFRVHNFPSSSSLLARGVAWKFQCESEISCPVLTRTLLRNPARVQRSLRKIFPILLEEISDPNLERAVELMAHSLELGLRLEISDVSEFCFVFWLLDFLTKMRISLVLKFGASRTSELAELQVRAVLYGAFFRLFVALEVGNFLKFPTPVLEAREFAYRLRTRNFVAVGEFENFRKAASLAPADAPAVLAAVADALRQASVASADGAVKRTCIGNLLAIKQLLAISDQRKKLPNITCAFKYSDVFPVVEVAPSVHV